MIDPSATLAEGCTVDPLVVIAGGVTVGANTHLRVGTVLMPGSHIGANCQLGPYAVIGGLPMDSAFKGEASFAVIADGCDLREFVSVHRATGEAAETRVGPGSLLMSYVHVSHNAQVGERCTLTTQVQLGGHTVLGERVVVGSSSILHQHARIGAYAMFGAGSAANRDILPFSMARGNPARHYRLNKVGLQRNGIEGARYAAILQGLRAIRRKDAGLLAELAQKSPEVRRMQDFVENSKRGILAFV